MFCKQEPGVTLILVDKQIMVAITGLSVYYSIFASEEANSV